MSNLLVASLIKQRKNRYKNIFVYFSLNTKGVSGFFLLTKIFLNSPPENESRKTGLAGSDKKWSPLPLSQPPHTPHATMGDKMRFGRGWCGWAGVGGGGRNWESEEKLTLTVN